MFYIPNAHRFGVASLKPTTTEQNITPALRRFHAWEEAAPT